MLDAVDAVLDGNSHNAGRTLSVLQTGLNWFAAGSGGLDRVFFDLVNYLPQYGVRVEGLVAAPADAAALTGGRIGNFAAAGSTMPQRLIGARRAIGARAASGNFDLLAGHFALHLAVALDRMHGLPLVMHFHGPWAEESRAEGAPGIAVAAKRQLERLVYRRAARIIVLSEAFGRLLAAGYGVGETRIRVVPGGVDLARFAPTATRAEARRTLGWPTDRPILLSVRRLAARMGLERLIAAMPAVLRRHPNALLCIAGIGPLAPALRAQAEALDLATHVRFLGFVDDALLPLAYRAADINVVPSAALEGFGLTAAEALAAGTPSMVTPVGGLPEVVAGLSSDLVLAGGDPAALADGLVAALAGRSRLPDEAACRAHALRYFDVARAAAATAAVYREVA